MTAAKRPPMLGDIDGFVHELARLRLLAFLSALKPADFVYLQRHSGLSGSNLSVQMRKLSEAGLLDTIQG